jgi:hypothetical protein
MWNTSIGKSEGKRPHGRSRRRWKGTAVDINEIGWERVDWIDLA